MDELNELAEQIWKTLNPIQTKNQPIAIFMMGIPASGKSSSIDIVLPELSLTREDFIHIDPDIFMSLIENYSNNQASNFNKQGVIISNRILSKIYESSKKHNYIYYGTGRGYKSYITMINKANKLGFYTILVRVDLVLEEALKRSKKRKRTLNNNIIRRINNSLKEKHRRKKGKTYVEQTNFEILSEKVDTWYIIDNNGVRPRISSRSREQYIK